MKHEASFPMAAVLLALDRFRYYFGAQARPEHYPHAWRMALEEAERDVAGG